MNELQRKTTEIRRRIAEIRASLSKNHARNKTEAPEHNSIFIDPPPPPPVYEKGYPSYEAVNRKEEREGYYQYMLRRNREENAKLDAESEQEQTNRELDDLRSKLRPKN